MRQRKEKDLLCLLHPALDERIKVGLQFLRELILKTVGRYFRHAFY
jgi:hypothetical protein